MRVIVFIEKSARLFFRSYARFSYRAKGLKFPSKSYLGTGIRFNHGSLISFGERLSLADGVRMWCEAPTAASRLKLGNDVQINRDVVLDFTGTLHIKDRVLVSEGAMIYTHSHGYDPRSIPKPRQLEIGEDVWIGSRAIILPSVASIGARSIIGAGLLYLGMYRKTLLWLLNLSAF